MVSESAKNTETQTAALNLNHENMAAVEVSMKQEDHHLLWADDHPHLPQEKDEGPVEYKRQLLNPTPERLQHLITQMKYRLNEGLGEALYQIGHEDDGTARGLPEPELRASLETLHKMADALKAELQVLRERQGLEGKCCEVLVRLVSNSRYLDIRVAVAGNVDSGKSTLIGVLTRGALDNGRGLARANVFTHKHEIESGRTSAVSQQIMGFDIHGNVIVQHGPGGKTLSSEEMLESCAKTLTFFDLAGHEKYLKTTVFGLTGHIPDYVLVAVGGNMGVTRMTREHLGIALALGVPVLVVVTKTDIAPEHVLKQTLDDVFRILKSPGARKLPLAVRTIDDVVLCAHNMVHDRIAPVFTVSSVTGAGLDLLHSFLNLLPASNKWDELSRSPTEFRIDETFGVLGVGTVVAGTVVSGVIEPNATLLLGPDDAGHFAPVQVKSIHYKRVPVARAVAGQTCSLALKKIKRGAIRKGMVLVDPAVKPKAARYFQAEILVLKHPTTIAKNYQPVIHCITVRQTASIVEIQAKEVLRTGDRATVVFKFLYRPEFLDVGTKIIFREGKTKGIGKVTKVFYDWPPPARGPGAAPGAGQPQPQPQPQQQGPVHSQAVAGSAHAVQQQQGPVAAVAQQQQGPAAAVAQQQQQPQQPQHQQQGGLSPAAQARRT